LHTSTSLSRIGQDPRLICTQVLYIYFGSRCLRAGSPNFLVRGPHDLRHKITVRGPDILRNMGIRLFRGELHSPNQQIYRKYVIFP